ncbi:MULTISPECIES: triose-phosphate isomerase family protein [Arthrobacter]|uniref:triose-phosphate isomerase family protein n=1 Tax=unclassified Arthrobacter TaxID=235627 RepID=UPI0024B8DC24|nr:triose-phosphate isomerase family protein [Arthrobacter sp. H35-MC1]MDJ0317339.1 triose-phosphate isomerase [Arthrobacter sp. H35-MC1]
MTHPTSTIGPHLQSPAIYIGASTKMYMGYQSSLCWLRALRHEVEARPGLTAGRVIPFVIPSFPVLAKAQEIIAGTALLLGAQNCGWADGPWTGEVAPSMLAELGVDFVEIGHAERRKHFAEDNHVVSRKVAAALAAGLKPLLCVGESENSTPEKAALFVYEQILAAVAGNWLDARSLFIAYEPVWAIGAAEPAAPGYISGVIQGVRALLAEHGLSDLPIVYGGSAKPGLLPQLNHVSGLFLGRFVHDPVNFGAILDEALTLQQH